MRYTKKRTIIWNRKLAYAVGLLATDGCLSSDGRHIDLTSIDIEQLTNFSKAINKDLKIAEKKNRSGTTAYHVQFSDVALYDFLLGIGLTPKKSHTIGNLLVPDELYRDFVRGVFDGDGSSYAFWDKRWKSSYVFSMSFASASLEFLNYVGTQNVRLAQTGLVNIKSGSRVYSINYGKSDTKRLFDFIYYSSKVICLSRKKSRLEGFFQTDKNGMLPGLENARVAESVDAPA